MAITLSLPSLGAQANDASADDLRTATQKLSAAITKVAGILETASVSFNIQGQISFTGVSGDVLGPFDFIFPQQGFKMNDDAGTLRTVTIDNGTGLFVIT